MIAFQQKKLQSPTIALASRGIKGIYQVQFLWQVAQIWNNSVEINMLPCLQLNQCSWVRKKIPLHHSLC